MPGLAISLLGTFHAALDAGAATGFESNKVRALLAFLAVEHDRPHRRELLAGLLWPEVPDAVARTNLRQALANLRQTIGDGRADPPYLLVSRGEVQFNARSSHSLDVAEFTTRLAACDAHPHRRADACTACAQRRAEAVELYRGDFLAGFSAGDSAAFEEWALVHRERLREMALAALAELARFHERRGEHERAAHYAARQLALDPWRETAYRQAMRALALLGQRTAALQQYATCRRVLNEELGVEPEAETAALYEQILAGVETLPRPVPPVLPGVPGPFIGRTAELARIAELLNGPDCRVLTLTGPGGIGKTRLALEAVAGQWAGFAHGAAWVSLAGLPSAQFLVPAIAAAVGVPAGPAQDSPAQLIRFLRGREVLLVLDNCEHVEGVAGLAGELLSQAPQVRILATSRERLNLRQEWLLPLEGLPVTADGDGSAMRLFAASAARVRPDFTPGPECEAVADICRLVDGTPLGIELAAGWTGTLSCAQIAEHIRRDLDFLATKLADVPERHRSLRTVFDNSWALLPEDERSVLMRLSVFRGGWQWEQAAQVCGATLPQLSALVEKSLVRGSPGERYDLHELLRQYAAERLQAAGEEEATRRRHFTAYLALAEAAGAQLHGPEALQGFRRLECEQDNLRAALGWATAGEDGATGLALCSALWWYWLRRGLWREGEGWLREALAGERGAGTPQRAIALTQCATLIALQGQYHRASPYLIEAAALAQALGDPRALALLQVTIAQAAPGAEESQRAFVNAIDLLRRLDDRPGLAHALYLYGSRLHSSGAPGQAAALYHESLALYRAQGDRDMIAYPLGALGRLALEQGDVAQARAHFAESLALAREMGNRVGIADWLMQAGSAALYAGDAAGARREFEEALALASEMGNAVMLPQIRIRLAAAALLAGEVEGAARLALEGLAEYRLVTGELARAELPGEWTGAVRVAPEFVDALGVVAQIAAAQGRPARAATLLCAADALGAQIGHRPDPFTRGARERCRAAARAALAGDAWDAACAAGRGMGVDDVLGYALGL